MKLRCTKLFESCQNNPQNLTDIQRTFSTANFVRQKFEESSSTERKLITNEFVCYSPWWTLHVLQILTTSNGSSYLGQMWLTTASHAHLYRRTHINACRSITTMSSTTPPRQHRRINLCWMSTWLSSLFNTIETWHFNSALLLFTC